ncbi:uncharacterized protein [Anabrus simplex]|uniref:uncharacterized protein isoform X1 n=1 Tax=Anabrus simplex TaxID=316456 RepID=UPI0035A2A353
MVDAVETQEKLDAERTPKSIKLGEKKLGAVGPRVKKALTIEKHSPIGKQIEAKCDKELSKKYENSEKAMVKIEPVDAVETQQKLDAERTPPKSIKLGEKKLGVVGPRVKKALTIEKHSPIGKQIEAKCDKELSKKYDYSEKAMVKIELLRNVVFQEEHCKL